MVFVSHTKPHGVTLSAVAAVIIAFLAAFYFQPVQSTQFTRASLWLQMADAVLGLEQPSTAHSAATGIEFIPQRFPHILQAFFLLTAAWVYGSAAVRLCLPAVRLTQVEKFVFDMGAGLAILSLVTLTAGLVGRLTVSAIFTPLVIPFAAGFLKRHQPPVTHHLQTDARTSSWIKYSVVTTLVPFVIYLLWGAITPQTDFDVREYHLEGPKEWFQQGSISCLRHNVYTSFPFLSEMLCLAGMIVTSDWRTGALTGQLVLAVFQLLSAAAVFSVARRWLGTTPAWIAVLIHLSTPWTLRISLIAYTEAHSPSTLSPRSCSTSIFKPTPPDPSIRFHCYSRDFWLVPPWPANTLASYSSSHRFPRAGCSISSNFAKMTPCQIPKS